jgi:photosystem II stability/assembly factor-like uncharacterized protein
MKFYLISIVLIINFEIVVAQDLLLDAGKDLTLNCFDEISLDAKIINWTINYETDVGLKSLFFVNDTIGYAAGGIFTGGKIIKTINGGESWFEQGSTDPTFLEDIHFLNIDTGFVTGGGYNNGIILMTIDGGINWIPKDNTFNEKINSIHFINDTTGFAVGERPKIIKTSDGGETWLVQNVDGTDYNDISFFDENIGFAVGDRGKILKTNNGGDSWELVDIDNIVLDLHSIDIYENNIMVSGEEGLILSSNDFFETFTIQRTNVLSSLYDIKIINLDTIVAVGRNSCILRSEDGGITWNKEYSEYKGALTSFFFLNESKQFIVGGASVNFYSGAIIKYAELPKNIEVSWNPAIFLSDPNILNPMLSPLYSEQYILEVTDSKSLYLTDTINISIYNPGIYAGTDTTITKNDTIQLHGIAEIGRWELQQAESRSWFNKIEFINQDTGFIVAGQTMGAIIKTTNGGTSWQHKLLDSKAAFFDICFTNDSTGYVIGTSGSIYKTTNYGENWYLLTTNTSAQLNSVHFVNENLGFATGSPDVVLKTEDSGETWQVSTIPNALDIERVYFINENKGFIVEDYPWECSYYKTINSGITWEKVIIPDIYPNPVDFFFLNENDGYMLGQKGGTIFIFKTNDGGETWTHNRFLRNHVVFYTSITFTDKYTGYITSGIGEIFKTTDGGKTLYLWDEIEGGVNDVSFIDENNAFAVGDGGIIAKYHAKGNIEFNWTPNLDILDKNTLNPYVFPKELTNYYLTVSDGNGCSVQDDIQITVDNISSIKTLKNNKQFNVYPNPSKEKIFIHSNENIQKVAICDINGQVLLEKKNLSENNSIDISKLKPGLYLLNITTEKDRTIIKIIKE